MPDLPVVNIPNVIIQCDNYIPSRRAEPAVECLKIAEFDALFEWEGRKPERENLCRACCSRFLRYGHTIQKVERL